MLLDLGRNDAGRVAQDVGTIKTHRKPLIIERYSHVMHIVSNVEAEAATELSALDVLKATFPAGTVSGAPKVRAMEIIDELEPVKRGIYAGAVGYLGFNGDMDLAIAIRTAIVKDGQDARAGRRRHRRRLRPGFRMAGNAEQGAGHTAGRRACRTRPRHALLMQPGLPQSAARAERDAAC
jgi:hypothetical protein